MLLSLMFAVIFPCTNLLSSVSACIFYGKISFLPSLLNKNKMFGAVRLLLAKRLHLLNYDLVPVLTLFLF
jgi:hypothetical protein